MPFCYAMRHAKSAHRRRQSGELSPLFGRKNAPPLRMSDGRERRESLEMEVARRKVVMFRKREERIQRKSGLPSLPQCGRHLYMAPYRDDTTEIYFIMRSRFGNVPVVAGRFCLALPGSF